MHSLKKAAACIAALIMFAASFAGAPVTALAGSEGSGRAVQLTRSAAYSRAARKEARWLMSLQLSDGSFSCYGINGEKTARINPYFGANTALALLRTDSGKVRGGAVKRFIGWYLAHINTKETDKNGVSGTIYDYMATIDGKRVISETSEGDYDSIDSYSAIFLTLVREYRDKYGDSSYISANMDKIDTVAGALFHTLKNGFSFATDGYPYKLLMDNCEVYRGLADGAKLFSGAKARRCARAAAVFKRRFDAKWWLRDHYASVLNSDGSPYQKGRANWGELYGFSLSQLFPVIFGVKTPGAASSKKVYGIFCKKWNWQRMAYRGQNKDDKTWSLIAYAAARMGDWRRLGTYYKSYAGIKRGYPFYSGDSSWALLAFDAAAKHYKKIGQ